MADPAAEGGLPEAAILRKPGVLLVAAGDGANPVSRKPSTHRRRITRTSATRLYRNGRAGTRFVAESQPTCTLLDSPTKKSRTSCATPTST
jgi:hypothetical protein